MDGTLIASEAIYREAWRRAAADMGATLAHHDYDRLMGLNRTDTLRELTNLFRSPARAESFLGYSEVHYDQIVATSGHTIREGIADLLRELGSRGIPLGVATSTHRTLAEQTLESTGLRRHFQVVMTGDEVTRGKPDPEIYLRAVGGLKLPAAACVAFEDSLAGATSAVAAGLTVVLIPELTPITAAPLPNVLRYAKHGDALALFGPSICPA